MHISEFYINYNMDLISIIQHLKNAIPLFAIFSVDVVIYTYNLTLLYLKVEQLEDSFNRLV
jgi:hypothetical protein